MRDFEIRELLKETELLKYSTDPNSKIVPELNLPIAGARIDIAVINGSFIGYEIKSAVDTLKRLPKQIEAYSKVFDYLSIVTENNHYGHVYELLPKWIGLYVCSEVGRERKIKEIRPPKINKKKSGFHIAKLLWREELINVLEEQNIPFRKKDRNWILCEILEECMSIDSLAEVVRHKLKIRTTWRESKEDYEAM